MEKSKCLILLSVLIGVVQSDVNSGSEDALYITPYLERGEVALVKSLAKVNYSEMKGVTSYSGYMTVNKTYDSNMFFWFFPAKDIKSPLIMYLSGGPGLGSEYGLFMGEFLWF